MQEMRQYPVFVSEEWAHVLAWSHLSNPKTLSQNPKTLGACADVPCACHTRAVIVTYTRHTRGIRVAYF